jgi:hypothetical protein
VSLQAADLLGRIGVIANPAAGRGGPLLDDVLRRAFQLLSGLEVVVVGGTVEASAARIVGTHCDTLPQGSSPGELAGDLARRHLDAGATTLIGIGGDGTLRDIADALSASGTRARLFGIGVGSSNVGPLVSARPENLERVLEGPLREVPIHAVGSSVDEVPVGSAFNDVVLANTYFGTREGRRLDLDAVASLSGEDRPAVPRSVCGESVWIAKNGRRLLGGREVGGGQIVVSPLNDVGICAGKAVSGFLCWGPYVGCHGLLAASSTVLIRTQLARSDLLDAEPLRLYHVGFAVGDRVEVGGLNEGAVVIDGSPRRCIDSDSRIGFSLLAGAVRTLRAAHAAGEQCHS